MKKIKKKEDAETAMLTENFVPCYTAIQIVMTLCGMTPNHYA
jgi:hypothetical protein